MKKLSLILIAIAFSVSACLPAFLQQPEVTSPPALDLNATAAVLSQQTLNALPSDTLEPTNTPVIKSPTETPTLATATETQNSILLTLTATLGTGTVNPGSESSLLGTPSSSSTPTSSATPSLFNPTITETAHPLHSGTMPPFLPFGHIELLNKSKADAYISMRCVTKEGNVTILEYPVGNFVNAKAPAGKYTYVLWVGGRQLLGKFSLSKNQDLTITIYKDRVTIK